MIHPVPKLSPKEHTPKPLARHTWMPRKRKTPRRSGRVRDQAHLIAVKMLPCCVAFLGDCAGPTEADHAGKRPLGRKCSDLETIPLCQKHHRDRTDGRGVFWKMAAMFMRDWCDQRIAETQKLLGYEERAA